MRYLLYYWPSIQGRGEFVRLALEEAGADYVDIARRSGKGFGVPALEKFLDDEKLAAAPYAPPFLKAGKLVIGQTANILQYLGRRHGLAPKNEAGRVWVNQLQLTVADFVTEIHDTHHPIAGSLYYRQQKAEAKRRTKFFRADRIPKFLGYFEQALQANGGRYLAGRLSYADLSVFQLIAGLRFAFPKTMKKQEADYPGLVDLHDRIAARPNVAVYLASKRRIPFNEYGIFRYYAELDG
ncbi:MAG TPA: glutathione S-transferase family protein [Burkholderiales bacterium]|nr:glutathione S-transferase family protein [Burkholderiales bacterium]